MRYRLIMLASALVVASLCDFSGGRAAAYSETMARTVKGEYAGKADSLATTLIDQFMNVTKGTFWSTPKDVSKSSTYIYWQQAHAMDVLVYAYERLKDTNPTLANKYKTYMGRWYTYKANNYSSGTTGFENPYTDDMLWICLTLMHMTEATGVEKYATTAKKVYDNTIMKRLKEDERGKWLPWNTDEGSGPNACTEGPACLLSVKLFEKYQDSTYLDNALMFYKFMKSYQCKSDGRCEEPPLTYTQGTFGEACRRLYHVKGALMYKNDAKLYINYAFTSGRCTNGDNILRHEGTSMDQSIFKAVLMPYAVNYVIDEKMDMTTRKSLSTIIQKNANTLWAVLDHNAYPSKMYCPYDWTKAYDTSETASMGAMASGASLMENCARMCITLTTNPSGIEEEIHETTVPEDENIYTLDGRIVGKASDGIENLPKGIYIINRTKVLVP
ncbi:MAG: alpha-1,6-mannanase [Bacteroidaceae bacterium]|nr:alpha-1,6-mannanase [Bacteroidaceae bacterium]